VNWENDTWGNRLLLAALIVSAAIVWHTGNIIWDALK
jgi:hypothetical protein